VGRALRQMGGLPAEALDLLARAMARICEDHTTGCSAWRCGTMTPGSGWPSSATSGFMEFEVDEAVGLVRVYTLVWVG
jgi:hypothetical protein